MNLKYYFDKFRTDKSSKHHYHEIYEPLFEPLRNEPINFLEIGVWKGHGLEAFHEYFPNANLYGVDIFTRITPDEVPVLKKERVNWLKCDSMSYGAKNDVQSVWNDIKFDVILDDAAHYPEANRLTFETFKDFLKPDGMYLIEDVWPIEDMYGFEKLHPWFQKHPTRYNDVENDKFLKVMNESGLKISRYDNREKTGEPDSYVIKLQA